MQAPMVNIAEYPGVEHRSRRRPLARALRQPTIAAGVLLLLVFLLAAIVAPLLSPYDPLGQNVIQGLKPPTAEHLLGTDKLGRDLLSRLLYGGRISLFVGLTVVAVSSVIGTLIGLLAGYWGGWA